MGAVDASRFSYTPRIARTTLNNAEGVWRRHSARYQEGQDRLERAKDRLDTKVAESGQAELDKGNVEPETETTPVEVNTDETLMDQGSPVSSTPRDAPEPQC